MTKADGPVEELSEASRNTDECNLDLFGMEVGRGQAELPGLGNSGVSITGTMGNVTRLTDLGSWGKEDTTQYLLANNEFPTLDPKEEKEFTCCVIIRAH